MAKTVAPAEKAARRTITVRPEHAGVAFLANRSGGFVENLLASCGATKIREGAAMLSYTNPDGTSSRHLVAIPDTITLEVIEEE